MPDHTRPSPPLTAWVRKLGSLKEVCACLLSADFTISPTLDSNRTMKVCVCSVKNFIFNSHHTLFLQKNSPRFCISASTDYFYIFQLNKSLQEKELSRASYFVFSGYLKVESLRRRFSFLEFPSPVTCAYHMSPSTGASEGSKKVLLLTLRPVDGLKKVSFVF